VNGYSGPGPLAASALLYLYVSNANGEKELYDLDREPYKLRTCYPEAGDAVKDWLRGRLSSLAPVPVGGGSLRRRCRGPGSAPSQEFLP
jgi:hypothetical protein